MALTHAVPPRLPLLSGFQLQLAKPVRPAELVAAVANLAGRTRPAVAAQAQEVQA